MESETFWTVVGAVGGAIGAATGIAALVISWKSYRTNDRMAKVNESMAESNREMTVAAQESANAARDAVEYEKATERAQNRANLVRRSGESVSSNIPYSRSGDDGTLGVRLFNEGPAIARDVRVAVTLQDGTVLGPTNPTTIKPETERSPAVRILESQFGNGNERVVRYRVTYRDGNGPQELTFGIKIVGPWRSDWQTFLEPAG